MLSGEETSSHEPQASLEPSTDKERLPLGISPSPRGDTMATSDTTTTTCLLAKLDLQNAYRVVPAYLLDYCLLELKWNMEVFYNTRFLIQLLMH